MKKRNSHRLLPLFLGMELLLYASFLCCDFLQFNSAGTILKYAALLLCLLFSLQNITAKDGQLVVVCLLLTAAADWFLLVINRYYMVGLVCFCAIQFLYALRIRRLHSRIHSCVPRLLLSGGALLVLFFTGFLTPLLFLVCLYFPQLVCNAAESCTLPSSPQNALFTAGLFLFLACDISVGIYNSPDYLTFASSGVVRAAQIAMWGFYLPSQVLIVLSAYRRIPS